MNLLSHLIGRNEFALAAQIAQEAEKSDLIDYYRGLIALGQGKSTAAETIFAGIDPVKIIELQEKYYFFYGESLRLQKKKEAADAAYKRALEFSNGSAFEEFIRAAREKLNAQF